jgi:hypothetical protein
MLHLLKLKEILGDFSSFYFFSWLRVELCVDMHSLASQSKNRTKDEEKEENKKLKA